MDSMDNVENREDLGIFNRLPQRRMYEVYARTLARQIQDNDLLSLLRTGRSRTVVAFMLPPSKAFTDAIADLDATIEEVHVSEVRESHVLSLLREQSDPPSVLAVTLGNYTNGHWISTPAVYIVPFNSHWRSVVAGVMGEDG